MGTWFVGAREIEGVYDAEDAMKSLPAECDDAGRDAWVGFLKKNGRWDDRSCEVVDHKHIFFDGGGCISIKEPKISWEANGCKMKTYVRHLPFTLDVFRGLKPLDDIPEILGFGGFMRKYFLSPKTVADSIEQMERLLKGTESLRQELEMDMHKTFNNAKHAASARKCGCMSGEMYGDCCGKYIETPEHRAQRKAISEA